MRAQFRPSGHLCIELLVREDNLPERRIEVRVEENRCLIGRGKTSLRLKDLRCSRHHALLYFDGQRLRLKDLGSQNGTQLNSHPVDESTIGPGDRIRIGQTWIVLVGYQWLGENPTRLLPLHDTRLAEPKPAYKPSVVRHWPDLYHCRAGARDSAPAPDRP